VQLVQVVLKKTRYGRSLRRQFSSNEKEREKEREDYGGVVLYDVRFPLMIDRFSFSKIEEVEHPSKVPSPLVRIEMDNHIRATSDDQAGIEHARSQGYSSRVLFTVMRIRKALRDSIMRPVISSRLGLHSVDTNRGACQLLSTFFMHISPAV